jgi:hypothetical protein
VTNTQRLPREQDPRESQDHQPPAENGATQESAALLPGWIIAGGWIPLAVIGVILIVVCFNAGTAYGAPDGWSLFLAPTLPTAAWLWSSYTRRAEELELRERLKLTSRIKITEIDLLRSLDFEKECIRLLRFMGYGDVRKTENLPKLKAVDITATAPGKDKKVVFECKHRRVRPIDVTVVNELIGRVASGPYKGLPVTLMTNARVTDGAREKAAEHGIGIIDREQLAELLAQASGQPVDLAAGRQGPTPHDQAAGAQVPAGVRGLIAAWFSALRPEARFATSATGASILAILIILLQMAVTGPRAVAASPAAPEPHSTAANTGHAAHPPASPAAAGHGEAPQAVARKFFTAISDHDWPEVWQLEGKYTARGPYATYQGMVSGYRDTIRDVPLTMAVTGDTVSGRFLAYETGNRVQTYTFTYVIRNGVIVSASQQVTATTS